MADTDKAQYYVFNNGIVSADTQKILADVQSEWTAALGNTLSLEPSTPQGRMIELNAATRKLCVTICSLVANQINPNYATGQYLDALASVFGVSRIGATSTIVYANITGTNGTVVPKGFIVKTEEGDEFQTDQAYTISGGSVEQAIFYSVKTGAIPCAAGTLNIIVSEVEGVTGVINPNGPIKSGADMESDLALRTRMVKSRYSRESLPGAVISAIGAIPGVISYWFYNNGEGSSVWVDPDDTISTESTENGVEVKAHSIILVIEGGSDKDIADAIFVTRSAGCGYTAATDPATSDDISKTVDIPFNTGAFTANYIVTFNRPKHVPIDCKLTVRRGTYPGTDAELRTAIKNAINAWTTGNVASVDQPQIGSTLYTYEIGAAVSAEIPEIVIQEVKIALHDETLGTSAIVTNKAQLAVFSRDNISVDINS